MRRKLSDRGIRLRALATAQPLDVKILADLLALNGYAQAKPMAPAAKATATASTGHGRDRAGAAAHAPDKCA